MREKYIDITIFILTIAIIITIGIGSAGEYRNRELNKLEIKIEDGDKIRFVTEENIISMMNSDSLQQAWQEFGSCNLDFLEESLYSNEYIKNSEVYSTIDGTLNILVEQKQISLRIATKEGYNIYVDSNCDTVPYSKQYIADVAIFSCSNEQLKKFINNEKKVEKNYNYLHNLLNFVTYIEKDTFWKDMFVQINLSSDDEIELVPRIGSHIVTLCNLDDLEHSQIYTKKLKNFYKEILSKKGWNSYSSIDVKYDKMVVAKKY